MAIYFRCRTRARSSVTTPCGSRNPCGSDGPGESELRFGEVGVGWCKVNDDVV